MEKLYKFNNNGVNRLRKLLLDNFYYFVHFMDIRRNDISLVPVNSLYKEVCDKISRLNKNTMILLPRRHLKTLITSLFITWYVIKFPDRSVVIVTDTLKKGVRLLRGIRAFFLRHKRLRTLFSDIVLAKEGNTKDILTLDNRETFAKEPNISIFSIEQPIQSVRADLLVKEDIVSDKFVKSLANRETIKYNLESIEAILEKDSKQIVTGTRYTIDDPYKELIDDNEQSGEWNISIYGIFNDDGTVLCPEVMSLDEVMRIKQRHSAFFFASQYLNDPISGELNTFTMEQYAYSDEIPIIQIAVMGIDLALGKGKHGDKSALTVVGYGYDKHFYIIDNFSTNLMSTDLFYKEIRKYYSKYSNIIKELAMEVNGQIEIAYSDFIDNTIRDQTLMPFSPIYNREAKVDRIERTLEPLLRNKILVLSKNFENIIEELTYFTKIGNNKDDNIDSLEMACNRLKERVYKDRGNDSGYTESEIF